MRSTVDLGLEVALDALSELDVDTLSVAELRRLVSVLSPTLGRLSGARTRLVGALRSAPEAACRQSPDPTARRVRRCSSGTGCAT